VLAIESKSQQTRILKGLKIKTDLSLFEEFAKGCS
jgi:hypothetical protein